MRYRSMTLANRASFPSVQATDMKLLAFGSIFRVSSWSVPHHAHGRSWSRGDQIESHRASRPPARPSACRPPWLRTRSAELRHLNLKHDEGRKIFLLLAAQSDVLVESFRPGVMDRLGLGYQAVQEQAPGIIYCSLSAFGQTGHSAMALAALARPTGVLPQPGPGAPTFPTCPWPISPLAQALIGILSAPSP
jgi:crotonobetainyl-CoA:carnitine CoA-transferase CaiB-like acyl-CoA transferase